MKNLVDLSIGQRLWIASGGLFLILAAAGASIYDAQRSSDRVQARMVEEVRPLSDAARVLENNLLYVDIAARTWLMSPEDGQIDAFEDRVDMATATLAKFEALPMDEQSKAQFDELRPLAERFLREAAELGSTADGSDASIERQESTATSIRERALAVVHDFADLQRDRFDAAQLELAEARALVARTFVGAGLLAMLSFLGFAWLMLRSIRAPVVGLLKAAGDLRQGKWKSALALHTEDDGRVRTSRDELVQLSSAVGAAAWALERREQRLQADGRIAAASGRSLKKDKLAELVLRGVVEHSKAQLGIVYMVDEGAEELQPIASQASSTPGALPLQVGIPGQAVRERRTVLVNDIPTDTHFRIDFGFNEAAPRAIAAIPVISHDRLMAVIMVASLRPLDDELIGFFEASARQLGNGLQNALAFERIQSLLDEVRERKDEIQAQNEELQAQTEEIQAQNEELQAQNEEIQAQNEEIQAQTEELQAQQAEIRESNDNLREHADRLSAQNTSLEEYSAKLREQREMLAEADRRKNDFLGLLAHELRNPLAPITSSLFILGRAAPGSESAGQALDVIGRQTTHLTRLVEDLLDITRISEGKIRIQREDIDLLDVVQSCVEDSRLAVQAAELSLDVDVPDGQILIDGDRVRIAQILGNLIGNAIKFTDDGGRITLSVRAEPDASHVEVTVADNGIGIEPNLLPNLFHPFMQGSLSGPKPNGGLGLGLSLVKSLVELHGGTVTAFSDGQGRGSRFVLRLPVKSISTGTVAPAAGSDGPLRILVIDDNVDAGTMLAHALRLQDHVVEVCTSASDGLGRATAEPPDVVLCDIGLPGMDGHEVARRLRENSRLDRTYLVAVTGYASPDDRKAATDAGFDEHIAKPVTLERLHEVFAEIPRRDRQKVVRIGRDSGSAAGGSSD